MSNIYPAAPGILFFGDPHGDLEPILRVTHALRPQAIVLLGDIDAERPLHVELESVLGLTEVWWIPGNHDTDCEGSHDNLWRSTLDGRNLHGRVATIGGYRVAGLGGVFRRSIWDPALPPSTAAFASPAALEAHMKPRDRWRAGISLRHRSSIFPSDYFQLLGTKADILVTHEGLGGAVHGQPALDRLAISMGVTLAVHGHLHRDIDYARDGLLGRTSPFEAFGVNKASYLCWPPAQRASRSGGTAETEAFADGPGGDLNHLDMQAGAVPLPTAQGKLRASDAADRIDLDAVSACSRGQGSRKAALGEVSRRQVQS